MTPSILAIFFSAYTVQFGLPPNLLSSLCYVESKHDIAAIHKDDGTTNSVGICQVKLKTAVWLGFSGTEKQLMDPKTNIYYSAKYLSYQLLRYRNNTVNAIIAYNKGNSKNLQKTKYSDKVLKQWRIFNDRRQCSKNSCERRPQK